VLDRDGGLDVAGGEGKGAVVSDRLCVVCKAKPAKGPTCSGAACVERFSAYRNATPMPPDAAGRAPFQQSDQSVPDRNDRDDYAPPTRERLPKRA
jgi:hypothetical protein